MRTYEDMYRSFPGFVSPAQFNVLKKIYELGKQRTSNYGFKGWVKPRSKDQRIEKYDNWADSDEIGR